MFRSLLFLVALSAAADVYADTQRDPTRPLDYRVSRTSVNLTLNAIMRGSERQVAIINGQQLRENDLIANSGGIRLVRIDARDVVVGQNGRQWRLNLNDEPVRRSRSAEQ